MKFEEMRKVMTALEGQELPDHGHFQMEYEMLRLPWSKKTGPVAEALGAAGCDYVDVLKSWVVFG